MTTIKITHKDNPEDSNPTMIQTAIASSNSGPKEPHDAGLASKDDKRDGLSHIPLTVPSIHPGINTSTHALGNAPETVAASVTYTIPAAIVGLPGLTLIERLALAKIGENPSCMNRGLANLLGISCRGVEELVSRLSKAGLVGITGKGRARRFIPLFLSEPHLKCGQAARTESHAECGVPKVQHALVKQEPLSGSQIAFGLKCYENCLEAANYGAAQQHLETVRQRIELDTNFAPAQKAKWITALVTEEDRCIAFGLGAALTKDLPPDKQRQVAMTLCKAPSDKLALLRQRVQEDALTAGSGTLLLDALDTNASGLQRDLISGNDAP